VQEETPAPEMTRGDRPEGKPEPSRSPLCIALSLKKGLTKWGWWFVPNVDLNNLKQTSASSVASSFLNIPSFRRWLARLRARFEKFRRKSIPPGRAEGDLSEPFQDNPRGSLLTD